MGDNQAPLKMVKQSTNEGEGRFTLANEKRSYFELATTSY